MSTESLSGQSQHGEDKELDTRLAACVHSWLLYADVWTDQIDC